VVFGKTGTATINLSAVASGQGGFVLSGRTGGDQVGFSVANAGDINGDGLTDLIVGARGVDVNGNNDAGRSFVILGNSQGALLHMLPDHLGTAGADTLTANGASVLYGGAGKDTFNIDQAMITALQSPMGSGGNISQLARIDGGRGLDTLVLSGSGLTLDLTQVANQAASNPDGGSRIDSVETIDLTGTGDNALKLQLRDVLDMGSANLFETTGRQQLLVKGNAGDTVDLADGSGTAGWTKSSTAVVLESTSYEVWNHQTSLVSLYVQNGVAVL
jgi:hypothetical protein